VELAGPLYALQFALDLGDAFGDQATIGLDLGLAGTAQKAEAAALALKMGPGPHQAAALIIEVGELDLERALPGPRPSAEDFQDQAGAVEHLGVPRLLQVALLHRRERAIHHHQGGLMGLHEARQFFHLALADIGRGAQLGQRHQAGGDHFEIDGARKPDRLFEPGVGRPALHGRGRTLAHIRPDDDGTAGRALGRTQGRLMLVAAARLQIRSFPRRHLLRRLRTIARDARA